MNKEEWITKELGPQVIGGHYHCGYWNKDYEVISVEYDVPIWGWLMTVRWDDGHTTKHCTAWDPRRDSIIKAA